MNSTEFDQWLRRNLKWLIPTVCLLCVTVFASFAAFILTFVFGMMKSSDAYQYALAIAQANPVFETALGKPIKDGFFISGTINVTGPSGRAELAIPISGSNGNGTIFVVARKSVGLWSYTNLVVEVEATKQRIDLLDAK